MSFVWQQWNGSVCQQGWCIAPATHRSIQSGSKTVQLPVRSFAFKSVLSEDTFDSVWLSNCERFCSEKYFYFLLQSALLCLFVYSERERWQECSEQERHWGHPQQISTNDVSCRGAVSMPCLCAWWIEECQLWQSTVNQWVIADVCLPSPSCVD